MHINNLVMKKYHIFSVLLFVIFLLSNSCSTKKDINVYNNGEKSKDSTQLCSGNITTVTSAEKPQNVILMIGDGMSTPQIYAAILASDSPTSFEKFPFTGLVKTNSKSHRITDSAAGGTAIATGHKTNNGMIGMNADSIAVPSMLDMFSDKGMKTGIVVTSYITHATPAAFVAKNINRNNYEEIALDFAQSDKVDLLIGGGRKYFSNRKDGRNLIQEMTDNGWIYYDTLINNADNEKIIILPSEGHLPIYSERGNFLPDATNFALKNLKNEDGFFLMIEGSQIDFAGHDRDSTYLVDEMMDFNNAINNVLDFAKENTNTLVIVTADHETGGLTIIDPNGAYSRNDFKFSTGSHSPLLVPVFAIGPGSDKFTGIMENTDIIKKIMELFE